MICTINKGSHYCSGYSLGSFHTGITSQKFKVMFDSNCSIRPDAVDCMNDWNKLFGFSYGMHHSNSLRLAWRALPTGLIRIASYIYENKISKYNAFATVPVNTFFDMGITYDPDNRKVYSFVNELQIEDSFSKSVSWGYYLKPYHGGNCPAPATVKITLL